MNEPYSKYQSVYEIAAGLKGDNGVLLSPNVALTTAVSGVYFNATQSGRQRLLGREATEFFTEALGATNNRRNAAIATREQFFPTIREFVEQHYLTDINAGICRIVLEEMRKLQVPRQ